MTASDQSEPTSGKANQTKSPFWIYRKDGSRVLSIPSDAPEEFKYWCAKSPNKALAQILTDLGATQNELAHYLEGGDLSYAKKLIEQTAAGA